MTEVKNFMENFNEKLNQEGKTSEIEDKYF